MKKISCNEATAARLFDYCEQLNKYEKITTQCSFEDDDHFGFMCLCFMSKQFDHLSAISRLFPHTDIQLVARTMIEGLIQLIWCHASPENAYKWRSFAWISDWRLLNFKRSCGQDIPESESIEVESALHKIGHLFQKRNAGGKSDPYHNNWRCGVSLKSIANDFGGSQLYNLLYSDFSDWQHWGVTSIGAQIERSPSTVHYAQSITRGQLCSSLAVAFLCTYQMIEIVNDHFALGLEDDLEGLKKEYTSANQESTQA